MKNRNKYLALLATATIATTAISTQAFAFQDVSSTYKPAVDFVVNQGIAKGLSSTQFGVTADITRGDAAVMIAAALQLDTASAPRSPFTDTNSRVQKSVDALYAAKIISGKSATMFAPDAKITRAEMAKILTNAFKLTPSSTPTSFTDVNTVWAPYVAALLEANITSGKSLTKFAPNDVVTRGEFALFIYRGERFLDSVTPPTPGADTTAPLLSYTGPSTVTVPFGALYTPPTVTATDNRDGTVQVEMQIFFGSSTTAIERVNTTQSGTYKVRYSARDKAGNATIYELTVIVQAPIVTTPPTTPVSIGDLNGTPTSPVVFNENLTLAIGNATSIDNTVVNGNLTLTGTVAAGSEFELINITVNGNLDLSGITGDVTTTNVNVTGDIIF